MNILDRISPRMRRWLKRVGIALAALVVLAAVPILWVETACMTRPEPIRPVASIIQPQYQRAEINTYLTYPEWSIVHAYEDLAAVMRRTSESDFDYFGAIRRFWGSLCQISNLASSRGTIGGDYKLMLYTIGLSFAGEMGIKGAYEKTLGRVTSWIAAPNRTPEDAFALAVADDYAKFLRQTPWYEYPFGATLARFWRDTPLTGGNIVRKLERRIALSLEWGLKSIYAKAIAIGAAASPAPLRIRSVVENLSSEDLAADPRITQIEQRGNLSVIETDRYAVFTSIIRGLAARNHDFSEIAGNRNIMMTVFAQSSALPAAIPAKVLISIPVETRPGSYRLALDVKVADLTKLIRALGGANLVLDHVYDY